MNGSVKLLAMSDVHGRFERFPPSALPDADLCVIAGDITNRGLRDTSEFRASERWLAHVVDRYRTTLWIPGNHDLHMDHDVYHPIGGDGPNRLHCILDGRYNHTTGGGTVSFYGVSMSPAYDMPELAAAWTHMTTRREVEAAAYALIPPDVDVVVSHCPPRLMQDAAGFSRNPDGSWEKRHIGSAELRRFIERQQPKAVICGQVHEAAGHLRYGATEVYNVAERWDLIPLEMDC